MKRSIGENEGKPAAKRLLSAVGAVSHHKDNDDNDNDNDRHDIDNQHMESPPKPIAESNPENVLRNKRLFGNLMGHLGLAKKKLDIDSSLIEQQASLKKEAIFKHEQEGQRLLEAQKEISSLRREKVTLQSELTRLKRNLEEVESATEAWLRSIKPIENSLVTSTEPKLTWQPARSGPVTAALLTARLQEVAQIKEERSIADTEKTTQLQEKIDANDTRLSEIDQLLSVKCPTRSVDAKDDGQDDSAESSAKPEPNSGGGEAWRSGQWASRLGGRGAQRGSPRERIERTSDESSRRSERIPGGRWEREGDTGRRPFESSGERSLRNNGPRNSRTDNRIDQRNDRGRFQRDVDGRSAFGERRGRGAVDEPDSHRTGRLRNDLADDQHNSGRGRSRSNSGSVSNDHGDSNDEAASDRHSDDNNSHEDRAEISRN